MIEFPFEKTLVDEVLARYVALNRADPECRKVLDTHLAAQKKKTKEAVMEYELALRELRVLRPWDNEGTGLILKTKKAPCFERGGFN